MEPLHHNKPAIEQGWLRALLFVVLFFVVIFGIGLAIGLLAPKEADAATTSRTAFLAVVANAIVAFLLVAGFRKWIDRQSFTSLGFETEKKFPHGAVGFLTGIAMLSIASIFLFFTRNLQWIDVHFNGREVFLGLGLMVIVALYEEVIFRGYILHNLMDSVNKWVALFITALLFAIAHTANPGITVISFINIFLAGLLLGINYIFTKNLWFAIALHFSWNFFQGPVLGYEVSGLNLQSVLQPELHGSEWLTGGKFGLEGSAVALVIYLLAIGIFSYTYQRKFMPRPLA